MSEPVIFSAEFPTEYAPTFRDINLFNKIGVKVDQDTTDKRNSVYYTRDRTNNKLTKIYPSEAATETFLMPVNIDVSSKFTVLPGSTLIQPVSVRKLAGFGGSVSVTHKGDIDETKHYVSNNKETWYPLTRQEGGARGVKKTVTWAPSNPRRTVRIADGSVRVLYSNPRYPGQHRIRKGRRGGSGRITYSYVKAPTTKRT